MRYMRRVVSCLLSLVFTLQSAGIASADPPGTNTQEWGRNAFTVAGIIAENALTAVEATRFGAFLTGRVSLWDSMHAPPPQFRRTSAPGYRPSRLPNVHRGTVASGTVARFPMALLRKAPFGSVTPVDPVLSLLHSKRSPISRGILYTYTLTASPTSINTTAGTTTSVTLICKRNSLAVACTGISASTSNSSVASVSIGTIGSTQTASNVSLLAAGATTISYVWQAQTASVPITLSQNPGASPAPTLSPSPMPAATPSTGVNAYWTYEGASLPGVGSALVNAGNGNLVFNSEDVNVVERGIDLKFHRTYNSQLVSQSIASFTSPGWTSSYESHIAVNSQAGTLTVYDEDGTQYPYTQSGSSWVAPPGQHATLSFDGCSYVWQKKDGSELKFAPPDITAVPQTCGYSDAAQQNRLMMLVGRDALNYITLTYSFSSGIISQLLVSHSNGQSMQLSFNTSGQLVTLSRPDGQAISYSYDANNNLGCVTELAAASNPSTHCYSYIGAHQLATVTSPRWQASSGTEGGYMYFAFDNFNHLTQMGRSGIANVSACDQSGNNCSLIQPNAPSGTQRIDEDDFTYSGSQTEVTDIDGHATRWTFDAQARAIQTQGWNGSVWLSSATTWDAQNNPIEITNVRGQATDYAYDANGNILAIELPSVPTSQGTIRPTGIYSYDSYNNLTSYCSPSYTLAHLPSWTPGNSPPACPTTHGTSSSPGPTVFLWATASANEANEVFGRLTDSYTPMGYHVAYQYQNSLQGGDYGLPTDATGDAISQSDGTTRHPHMLLAYDSVGRLTGYASMAGSGSVPWNLISYDLSNRPTTFTDADGYVSYKCYYANDSLFYTETALQHSLDSSPVCPSNSVSETASAPSFATSFIYDSDGNVKTETHHYNVTSASVTADVTKNWYDGEDRLVEVDQPQDSSDAYAFPWRTRYLYDLSQNGSIPSAQITVGNNAVTAHGNLAATQECLNSIDVTTPSTAGKPSSCSFSGMELKGQAFDALDRIVAKYTFSGSTVLKESLSYDAQALYGLLVSDCVSSQPCETFSYDAINRTVGVQHNDSGLTPDQSMTFDPDGRKATDLSNGAQESYQYDGDGHLLQVNEPSSKSSAATTSYGYYPDGKRQSLSVQSSALTQANMFSYSYRDDGKLQTQNVSASSFAPSDSVSIGLAYTLAGRRSQLNFSGSGAPNVSPHYSYDSFGQESSQTIGSSSGMSQESYDAEGEILSYFPTGATTPLQFSYTTRGEMSNAPASASKSTNKYIRQPVSSPTPPYLLANGLRPENASTAAPSGGTYFAQTIDARMGVPLSWSGECSATTMTACTGSGSPCVNDAGALSCNNGSFTWDAMGRLISKTLTSYSIGSDGSANETDFGQSNAYDGENRLVRSTTNSGGGTATTDQRLYAWGPDGKISTIGEMNGTLTLHWDGDNLLFVSDSLGNLVNVKVGELADLTLKDTSFNGVTFYARNVSGDIAVCYNTTGVTGNFTYAKARSGLLCPTTTGVSTPSYTLSTITQCYVPIYLGRDGIFDWINEIQGTRSYDSDAGTWTTPDPLSGENAHPISQKSYVWNNDNSAAFVDPTGLSPSEDKEILAEAAGVAVGYATGAAAAAAFTAAFAPLGLGPAAPIIAFGLASLVGDVGSAVGKAGGEWLYNHSPWLRWALSRIPDKLKPKLLFVLKHMDQILTLRDGRGLMHDIRAEGSVGFTGSCADAMGGGETDCSASVKPYHNENVITDTIGYAALGQLTAVGGPSSYSETDWCESCYESGMNPYPGATQIGTTPT